MSHNGQRLQQFRVDDYLRSLGENNRVKENILRLVKPKDEYVSLYKMNVQRCRDS